MVDRIIHAFIFTMGMLCGFINLDRFNNGVFFSPMVGLLGTMSLIYSFK